MKKVFSIAFAILMLLSCGVITHAADCITVIINGETVDFDVPPQIINGRTMVPVRKAFEALGAKVDWSEEMSLAVATYKTEIIAIPIGENSLTVTSVLTNETRTVELDVPAQIVGGRTLVPLRAISEALGKEVKWNGETSTAYINDIS